VVTNVLIDQATFERALAELAGATPVMPLDPFSNTYRCSTIDGAPLDPTGLAQLAVRLSSTECY